MSRTFVYYGLFLALLGALANCTGTSSSSGASEVAITGEDTQSVGNLCAIKGHATNVGNLRVNVSISYEAQNAAGVAIGTSVAFFQIAAFSNFDFGPTQSNDQGQPSSGTFSNNLSCSAIARFRRTNLDVTH